ncbi:MAG: DegV family protein [Chloroflexi bacterium]|jgi:DegV family protein with EDD domain|nr:DegV family protein [Chloroflexota bacterium]
MSNARIVTDSAADLDPEVIRDLGIVVVPHRIQLGTETLSDDPELRSAEFYKKNVKKRGLPALLPPSAREFTVAYTELAREADEIVSIHVSSELVNTYSMANQGKLGFAGRGRISVVDSGLISRAQGILVEEAARAAMGGASAADIIRLVRGMMPRLYLAFHVDSISPLVRSGLLPAPRRNTELSSTPKTLFLLEEGQVVPFHRTRSRGTATERLTEFLLEFVDLQQLAVLHSGLDTTRKDELVTMLQGHFPPEMIQEHVYGLALGAFVGLSALAVVAFEG